MKTNNASKRKQRKDGGVMLGKLTRANQVTLPKGVVAELGLEQGDWLQFEAEAGRIVITPVQVTPIQRKQKGGD